MLSRTQADKDAVRRSHRRLAKATLWYPAGSQGEIPFEAGSVSFSLSTGNGNRSGRLTVPGYEWWDKVRPRNYSWVVISVEVEGVPFSFGEFPIMRAVVERPRGTVELTLGDWSYRRAQPMGESAGSLGSGMTVAQACQTYMSHVMPGGSFTITRDDSNGAPVQSVYELSLGGSVWNGLQTFANQVGCVFMVTGRNTGQIRKYLPSATAVEDLTGTVTKENLGEFVDGLANRVVVELESSDPGATDVMFRSVRTLTTGPYAYDVNKLGNIAVTSHARQFGATQAAADAESQRLYDRRVGIVLAQDIEVVPQPWLQLGDVVTWTPSFTGQPVTGLIDGYTFPLTAEGTQRIALRDTMAVAA